MTASTARVGALTFVPFEPGTTRTLRRPRRFRFLDRIGAIPLADSELLQVSHSLPVALRDDGCGFEVVALFHPELVAKLPLRRGGGWAPAYMPIALRSLPVRRVGGQLEVATDLHLGSDGQDMPVSDEAGAIDPAFAKLLQFLERLEVGQVRLRRAAARLVAADLAVPLEVKEGFSGPAVADLLVVSPRRLEALTPTRTAALAEDGFLALDLAAASCFSGRLLSRLIGPRWDPGASALADEQLNQLTHKAFPIDLRIDDGPLFSWEDFRLARPGEPERISH